MSRAAKLLQLLEADTTIKQMTVRLKNDGIWIADISSVGIKHKHSQWWLHWNDRDDIEMIYTDGTDGGSSKAWQEKLAKEKAIAKRYKEQYPNE